MNPCAPEVVKFPRTPHLAGSELQAGDEDLPLVRLEGFGAARLFVTEKVDGTNVGLRFDASGKPWLQSRGQLLGADPQFDRLKQWAHRHAPALFARLSTRYLLYGEWLFARHTVFYDALPSYLLSFDVLELERGAFLTTPAREALLHGLPLQAAPPLWEGPVSEAGEVRRHLGASRFRTPDWRARLAQSARERGLDVERTLAQSDQSAEMEGLYFRVEAEGEVRARFKFVRRGFRQALDASGSHWKSRPLLPNLLRGQP